MNITTCWHPNCHAHMSRNRHCCPRHWFQLPEDTRAEINRAASNPSDIPALRAEAEFYFEDRLIGDHEIVHCRGKDCAGDVVWLVTKNGKPIAVNADQVEADDDQFQYGRHVAHFTICPNAADFRKR